MKEYVKEINKNLGKSIEEISVKIDVVDDKIKLKNKPITTKIEDSKGSLDLFRCQNDLNIIKEKINNVLDENDIKKLISNSITKRK